MDRGLLIAIEGIDKAGKTTQIDELAKKFVLAGEDVLTIHFPAYDTPSGQAIQAILDGVHPLTVHDSPMEVQALYAINRYEQQTRIETALMQGKVVICDRYLHSGIVYGVNSGLDKLWLEQMQHSLIQPDIVVLLEIDEETYKQRCLKDDGYLDSFESDLPFIQSAIKIYRRLAEEEEWICLDGTLSPEELSELVFHNVKLKIAEMEDEDYE